MGRGTKYTDELVDEIIDRVSNGEPLAQVCRDEHTPQLRTFYDWLERDEALTARFARARIAGFDHIAAEALRIADTPVEGTSTKETDSGIETRREDMLGHRKLQVETRLKLLAKWDPKRYGDKLQVGQDPDSGPIKTESTVSLESVLTDEQRESLAKMAREVLQQGGGK